MGPDHSPALILANTRIGAARATVNCAVDTCQKTRIARSQARMVRGDTVTLITRAHALRGVRDVSGGSANDQHGIGAVILSAMLAGATCAPCIAQQARAELDAVARAIVMLSLTIEVLALFRERCQVCGGTTTPVYAVRRRP